MRENKVFTWFLFAVFFLPLVYKAFNASFTHDEAFSYLNYVKRPFLELMLPPPHYTANNHVLNSLLMKCMSLFSSAEGLLRLPNLVAGVAWFWGLKRWFNHFKAPLLLASPLLFIPYVVDFFALARGYGLAMAAFLWLVILIQQQLENPNSTFWWKSGLLSTLLLWSNLSFLTPWLALVAIAFGLQFNRMGRNELLRFVFAQALALLTVVPTLLVLIAGNQLYYGHSSNLFHWTLGYLPMPTYHPSAEPIWTAEHWSLFLLIAGGLALCGVLVHWFKYGSARKAPVLPLLVLTLSLIGSYLQMLLFNTPYPVGRTALYIWPLLFLPLAGWGHSAKQLPGIFLGVGCLTMAPFSYSPTIYSEWGYDAHTKEAMAQVKEGYSAGETISHSWLLEPSMNYYREKLHLEVPAFGREGVDSTSNWMLVLPEDREKIPATKEKKEFPNHLLLVH